MAIERSITPDVPLVFLHAYPLDGSMWDAEVERFADRATLAPSFPGFGGRPAGGVTLDAFAEFVAAEMDVAGIARAVIVGLSLGGYVAFRLLESHPERIAGLVLADTRSGPDTEAAAAKRAEQAERARREGIQWLPDAMIEAALGETTRRERPMVVERVRRMIERASAEGVARTLLAMRDRPDSTPLLGALQVPLLVIVGAEDTLTPPDESTSMVAAAPDSRLVIIPGAGHLSNLENPGAFAAALQDFLG